MRLIDADKIVYYESIDADTLAGTGKFYASRELIDAMPTIEERKTGKWIQFPNHMAYKCSECGRVIQTTDGRRNVSKHYPFCHCGAKMEVEE